MSNPNKHKPLSPEELFKLLDNTSNKASDFDELDDFEREALEGFAAHSDSKKAQALTDELNIAISQKASGAENNQGNKNKVIWFSAAASIVVIIMISVFFFNQTKEESQTNIALNETKEDKSPIVSPDAVPPVESVSEPTTGVKATVDLAQKEKEIAKVLGLMAGPKKEVSEINSGLATEAEVGYTENKPALSPAVVTTKDESKSSEGQYDALQKQAEVLAGKMDTKERSKNSDLDQEKTLSDKTAADDGVATNSVAQKVTVTSANTIVTREESYKKEDELKSEKAKKSREIHAVAKEQAATDAKAYELAGYTKSNAAPAQGSTIDNNNNSNSSNSNNVTKNNNEVSNAGASANWNDHSAYYLGNESAIRGVVLDYFKDKSLVVPIGKYKVKGSVDAKGKLKVTSITRISREDCKCVEHIESALNSMKKWNPCNHDGKDISSNVEFTLTF